MAAAAHDVTRVSMGAEVRRAAARDSEQKPERPKGGGKRPGGGTGGGVTAQEAEAAPHLRGRPTEDVGGGIQRSRGKAPRERRVSRTTAPYPSVAGASRTKGAGGSRRA